MNYKNFGPETQIYNSFSSENENIVIVKEDENNKPLRPSIKKFRNTKKLVLSLEELINCSNALDFPMVTPEIIKKYYELHNKKVPKEFTVALLQLEITRLRNDFIAPLGIRIKEVKDGPINDYNGAIPMYEQDDSTERTVYNEKVLQRMTDNTVNDYMKKMEYLGSLSENTILSGRTNMDTKHEDPNEHVFHYYHPMSNFTKTLEQFENEITMKNVYFNIKDNPEQKICFKKKNIDSIYKFLNEKKKDLPLGDCIMARITKLDGTSWDCLDGMDIDQNDKGLCKDIIQSKYQIIISYTVTIICYDKTFEKN